MTKRSVGKAALAVALLALGRPGFAQQSSPGPQEGVKVHGHWTVIVRNADGTVASHHEFENSITDWGKGVVLGLLAGSSFMNGATPVWELNISGPLCLQKPATTLGDCQISVHATRPIPAGTTNIASIPLEMSGTVKMDGSGQIMSVATQITNMTGKRIPGRAPENMTLVFSSRDLTKPDSATGQTPAPINVQAGQNVDFTVDISIS